MPALSCYQRIFITKSKFYHHEKIILQHHLICSHSFFRWNAILPAQYYNQPTKKENTAEVLGAIFGLITVVAVADEVDKGNMTLDEAGEFFENLSDLAETLDAGTKNQKPMAKPQAQPSPTPQAERRYNTEPLQTYNLLNYYNTLQSINYYDALGRERYAKSSRQ